METVPCIICGSNDFQRASLFVARDTYAPRIDAPSSRSTWVICKDCGLVFQNPRPDASDVVKLYVNSTYRQYDDWEVKEYAAFELRRPLNTIEWLFSQPEFRKRFAPPNGHKALDIGSGHGAALYRLNQRGFSPTGVEPDPECTKTSRSNYDIPVKTEFFTESTFPDTDFSFAFSQHVFEHLRDPYAVALAARKVLDKQKGLLFICIPTYRKTWTYNWPLFNTSHTYMFTHKTLGNLLFRAGFSTIAHRYFTKWEKEGELWVLARADRTPLDKINTTDLPYKENVWSSQLELGMVPATAAVGTLSRLITNSCLLLTRPKYVYENFQPLNLLVNNPTIFAKKVRRKLLSVVPSLDVTATAVEKKAA